jgi:Holliday junction resolvase RusA-like endonuclease
MNRIVLTGNPISVNNLYQGRRYLSRAGKQMKEDYQWQIRRQWLGGVTEGPIEIKFDAYFPKKNKRDLDNALKAILDSLSGTLWVDDTQIMKIVATKNYDKDNPRVEIEVKSYLIK